MLPLVGQRVESKEQLVAKIEANNKALLELNQKISHMRIFMPTLECDSRDALCKMRQAGYCQSLNKAEFQTQLTGFISCLLSEGVFASNMTNVLNILNSGFDAGQFKTFLQQLSSVLLLKTAANQEAVITRCVSLIRDQRLRLAASPQFSADGFNRFLLLRLKADALVYPILSKNLAQKSLSGEHKSIWRICIEDLDNFLLSFDMLTDTPITNQDAASFTGTYQMSLAVLGQFGTTMATAIGAAAGGAATVAAGAAAAGIGLAVLFIPFILNAARKMYFHRIATTPSKLPPLLVFSDPDFYRGVASINNRDHILNQINAAWNDNVTPILVGDSGCGKTSILIELARRINEKTLPGFQGNGFKLFGGSAASLVSAGGQFGGNGHIDRIFKKIAQKREHTILALDEIHIFNEEQKALLRSFFDNQPNTIRYAVFATTHDGAAEFYKGDDGSLDRRFRRITVPDLTTEETESVLIHQALSMAPLLTVHHEVIGRIVRTAKGKFASSRKILCQILRKAHIRNTTYASQKAFDQKVTELELAKHEHGKRVGMGHLHSQESAERLNGLNKEMNALKNRIDDEKLVIKNHEVLLAKRTQLRFKIFELSHEIQECFQKHLHSQRIAASEITADTELLYFLAPAFTRQIEAKVQEFIYYHFVLQETLNKRLAEFEQKHGLMSTITSDFVTDDELVLVEDKSPHVAEKKDASSVTHVTQQALVVAGNDRRPAAENDELMSGTKD